MFQATMTDDLPARISRIGRISEIHEDNYRVKIQFEGNPLGQPIWGSIGRAFTCSEIFLAIDNQLDCRIDFLAGDLSLPILVDIYFSLLGHEHLVIKAQTLTLEGEKGLTIRSGEAQTEWNAASGTVKTQARYLTSTAEKIHKIQAKKITLN